MADPDEDSSVRVRIRGRELSLALSEEQALRLKGVAHTIWHEPFTMRVWSELGFFLLSAGLAEPGRSDCAGTWVPGREGQLARWRFQPMGVSATCCGGCARTPA